jgi:hypothetical protein
MDRYEHWLSPLARFHEAPWYYLLTGADFKKDALPDYIRVSAVVEVAGQAVLYRGTLDDWFVNSDNGQLVGWSYQPQPVDRSPRTSKPMATVTSASTRSTEITLFSDSRASFRSTFSMSSSKSSQRE